MNTIANRNFERLADTFFAKNSIMSRQESDTIESMFSSPALQNFRYLLIGSDLFLAIISSYLIEIEKRVVCSSRRF
jgi:hypothetical protein